MRRLSQTLFVSLILLGGIVFAGCGSAGGPGTSPAELAKKTMTTAKATATLTTRAVQEVLHKVDPDHFSPSNLTQGIVTFTPLPDGGRVVLDFGEGHTVDTLTVSGQIVSTFTLTEESLTVRTSFSEATIKYYEVVKDEETGEPTGEIIDLMMKVDGTLNIEISLTWTTATCTIRGPLYVDTYQQDFTLNFNGVTAVLDAANGTTVFNGPVRLVTQDFGNWRVTFKNLLFRLKLNKGAIDIDSGRVIQERLATPIKWKAVYKFLDPNKGEVTFYPGGVTLPFNLEPPPAPPEEPEEPAEESQE